MGSEGLLGVGSQGGREGMGMPSPDKQFLDTLQTDYGCDIEHGSVCTYHPGAVHCVRSVQAR